MNERPPQPTPRGRAEPITWRDFLGFKETAFAFFLSAGLFKGTPIFAWFPVDVTLLAALVTIVLTVQSLVRRGDPRYRLLFLLLGCFLAFAPSLLWTVWHPYAIEKVSRFYTLTLLSAVAPLYLIRTFKELRRFLCAFSVLSVLTAVGFVTNLITAATIWGQLAIWSASVIALGRAIGVVILFLVIWYFKSVTSFATKVIFLAPLAVLLFAVGERGPLIMTALTFLIGYLSFQQISWQALLRSAMLVLAMATLLQLSATRLPEQSIYRMQLFFGGQLGESGLERVDKYRISLSNVPTHPWGVGLGGFAVLVGAINPGQREFTHNIFIEGLLEGGWLAGIYLLVLSWKALRRTHFLALKYEGYPELQLLFCFLLFFLLNSLISGEVNDDKVLFALISLSLGFGAVTYDRVKSRSSHIGTPALRSAHLL